LTSDPLSFTQAVDCGFYFSLLGRPTSSADLGFTVILLSFFFFFYFVSYPVSSLNGTQTKPVTCPKGSAI